MANMTRTHRLPCTDPDTVPDMSVGERRGGEHGALADAIDSCRRGRVTSSEPDRDVDGFVTHLAKHFSFVFCIHTETRGVRDARGGEGGALWCARSSAPARSRGPARSGRKP